MRIATYNVNGIKARLERVLEWLESSAPDVAVLQEIKATDDSFPREPFEERGYHLATHGQKSFNGVAILSRLPLEDVVRGLPENGPESGPGIGPDGAGDGQARWIEATVVGRRALRICGLYLPNGNPAPGPKYDYKLAWMARLLTRARALLATEEPVLLGGDWNVIPEDRDAARPAAWALDALALPPSRAAFRRVLNLGYHDALRLFDQSDGLYSYWDFQRAAWERNDGIRIDHWLVSPQAADLLTGAGIERDLRARERPSDHVPVWIEIDA
ncbi:MAG: exodeoxyribonuclease III [Rubellimicrobium sp.]|nr:exodeoxyribonuclease III [Rubellimicrobium sp.]